MARPFRVIDTGIRDGRRQIALDQAMIDAHKAGKIPGAIRFLRFPPTVLIGRHQALSREIRLGVNAKYRPRNDIEVEGRKLGGTGGFFDGDTLFNQGTVLVDMNAADIVAALNVPQAKLAKRSLDSAVQRVVTLKELLGATPGIDAIQEALLAGFAERLGITPLRGDITADEAALAAKHHDQEIGTDAFVREIDDPGADDDVLAASHTGAGGTITAFEAAIGAGR